MLSFRRLDVIVAHPGAPPDGNSSVLVSWDLVTQHSGLDRTTFRIERSLSPQFTAGEFTEIAANIPASPGLLSYEFDDITPNLFSFWRRYYYRVVATAAGDPEVSTTIRTWETNPRPHELAIIERHDLVLKVLQGTPVFAFVERTTEGTFCICWNPTTSRSSDSRCTLCLGTGKQRPFFEPIHFYADFNPDEKLVSISNFGERQAKQKDCWISAYPQLKPGDIILEVVTGVLWRIASVHPIQPQGTTIQQVCRLSAIGFDEVEYQRLPQKIAPARLIEVVREWERVKEERLF